MSLWLFSLSLPVRLPANFFAIPQGIMKLVICPTDSPSRMGSCIFTVLQTLAGHAHRRVHALCMFAKRLKECTDSLGMEYLMRWNENAIWGSTIRFIRAHGRPQFPPLSDADQVVVFPRHPASWTT